MRILMTGGLGWTAQAIIQALAAAGHEIVAFDLPAATPAPEIEPLLAALHRGSVANPDEAVSAMRKAEAAIHLAIAVGDDDYMKDDVPFQANVQGTHHVFEAARLAGVQKVLLMGSAPVHVPPPGKSFMPCG